MKKIFELPERFVTGEPTMLVVAHWNGHRHVLEKAANYRSQGVSTKLASPAFDYISNVQPRDGETIILVNALGSFEWYDDNRNGDGFNELPYKVGVAPTCGCTTCVREAGLRGWVNEDEVVTKHYHTFEQGGGIYQHHANKDSTKSLGRVERAFWNPDMHRVELLLALVNSRCPDWINEIENGIYAPVSMGCHVRWDVCTNCGHRAPTRREYCDHCKYSMRQIDPRTGVRNCVLNPRPRFFDISKVFRPADKQAYMIKKVAEDGNYAIYSAAELGERLENFERKQAAVAKLSDIHKALVGDAVTAKPSKDLEKLRTYRLTSQADALNGAPLAGPAELSAMAEHTLPEIASTLASKSAGLTFGEMFSVLYKRAGLGFPSDALVARAVYLQPVVYDTFTRYPHLGAKLGAALTIDSNFVRPELATKLANWLSKRAGIRDWLRAEVGRSGLPFTQHIRDTEPARTDMLYYTDPHTGHSYRTTRGAAMAAHDEEARADLVRRAGSTMLLAGGYRMALGGIPGFSNAPGLLTVGAPLAAGAYTSKRILDHYHPVKQLTSDEGYALPETTEMMKQNEFVPVIPARTYYDLVSLDYVTRIGPHAKLAANLETQLLQELVACDPSADVVKLAAFRLAPGIARFEAPADSTTEPPPVDLDGLCQAFGHQLVG